MKPTLKILLFLLLPLFANAQQTSSTYTSQIDSVQTLLNKLSKSDTLRVIELNRLARLCIHDLQYERGLTAASEARAIAKVIDYQQGEGMYLRTLDVLHDEHFWQFPYDVLAYWSFERINKPEPIISIQEPAKIDESRRITELELAAKAFEKTDNPEMQAHVFYLLAFHKSGEIALVYVEKAEHIFTSLKLDIPLIEAKLLNLSIRKDIHKDVDLKNEELEISKIAEEHELVNERAMLMGIVAEYYVWIASKIEVSIDYSLKTAELLEGIGDRYYLATIYYHLGYVIHFAGSNQKSIEYLEKSFEIRKKLHVNSDGPPYYFYMFYAWRLTDVGDFKKAVQMLDIGKSLHASKETQLDVEG